MLKKLFKTPITKVLWWQVARLRAAYKPIVIAVSGSVGKTSTKAAVAHVLSQKYSVAWQKGNYNDLISIPLVFFMKPIPILLNPFAWILLFIKNELMIRRGYSYRVVVLELGTDHAGDMKRLEGVLEVDYTLLTAITPEHMQGFEDIDDVAKDELIASKLAKLTIVDADSVPEKYVTHIESPVTISRTEGDCLIKVGKVDLEGRRAVFELQQEPLITYRIKSKLIGAHNLSALAFALLIGLELELSQKQLQEGLESFEPFAGRMRLFKGKKDSVLVDDTYNSSPHALKAALDTLYEIKASKKIAVLGQMNEMGRFSEGYHREAGEWCDPKQLDLLVTLGEDTNKYLAKEAEKRGCKVVRCSSPYQAADIVLPLLDKNTVVLLKGSQNGGFLEEATALLLKNKEDAQRLVRQSDKWIAIKERAFK